MTASDPQAKLRQQIVDVLRTRAGAHFYTLADQADEILKLVRKAATENEPPAGWFHLGSHLNWSGTLEFSAVTGEDGLPLWARPLPTGDEGFVPKKWVPTGAGWREVADGETFPGGLESVTHFWLAQPFHSFHKRRTWVREPLEPSGEDSAET